jgi:hypothetical protein
MFQTLEMSILSSRDCGRLSSEDTPLTTIFPNNYVTITAVSELNSRIVSFVNCFDIDLTGAIDSIQKGGRCFPLVFPWLCKCSLYIVCLYTDFYASDHQTTLDL